MIEEGFTKLKPSLVTSTIWREPAHVRLVWITMLAICNRFGEVAGSVPGLADAARVTIDSCRDALDVLSSPDPDSRTKTNEGRRIEEIAGGWLIINYLEHRGGKTREETNEETRERMRVYRARKKMGEEKAVTNVTHVTPGDKELRPVPSASASVSSSLSVSLKNQDSSDFNPPNPPKGGKPAKFDLPDELKNDDDFVDAWEEWLAYKREKKQGYKSIGGKKVLAGLTKRGAMEATRALTLAMEKGWQGPAARDAIEREDKNSTPTAGTFESYLKQAGKNPFYASKESWEQGQRNTQLRIEAAERKNQQARERREEKA